MRAQHDLERSDSGVVVVGASLAGVAVVEQLRAGHHAGHITMIDAGEELPYDRPPLSKQFLSGTLPAERLALKPPEWFDDNRVDREFGVAAARLCVGSGGQRIAVILADGRRLEGQEVVIATGGRAIIPHSGTAEFSVIRTLRTLSDAQLLRGALTTRNGHLLVVGAGFIGLEVASAAAKLGWRVTVVDLASSPLQRVLPPEVVAHCLAGIPAEQVDLRCDTALVDARRFGDRLEVTLSDGSVERFDELVAGIGMRPNTEWLEGSGIAIDDGVTCDGQGRTSVPHVWAAGDVARWPNTSTGQHRRLEQWQSAREQGRIVGRAILGGRDTWDVPPYFWTELFGRRIQVVGALGPGMGVRTFADDRGRSISLVGDRSLSAVVVIGNPTWTAAGRRWLMDGRTVDDAADHAAELVVPVIETVHH